LGTLELGDVVAGPIYDIRRIFADAQYTARGAVTRVDDPDVGPLRMQSAIPLFSRTPGRVRHAGLSVGNDNASVYREDLGLTEERYDALRKAGVI
jgi:formyl-CoA transferase